MTNIYILTVDGLNKGMNRKDIKLRIDDNGCFICVSHTVGSDGYPQIYHNGRVTSIARMLMETRYERKLPYSVMAIHSCDNKLCINPDHISIGDRSRNNRECRDRLSPKTNKLTPEQVDAIRLAYSKDLVTQSTLGEIFGVGQDEISRIVNHKKWRKVNE